MNVPKLSHNMPSDMLHNPLIIIIIPIPYMHNMDPNLCIEEEEEGPTMEGPFGFEILEVGRLREVQNSKGLHSRTFPPYEGNAINGTASKQTNKQ
jgi:hypothetical protein